MTTYRKLYDLFVTHLNGYVQENGPQNLLQIKQIAKNYAIQSRNGQYDITARKRYCSLFYSYCWQNNIPQEAMPEGWRECELVNHYDPDNEFPEDPHIQRLTRNNEKKNRVMLRELFEYMRNRREGENLITE
jgi:hypothetical protein